jgi:hypothetical protein
VVLDQYLDQFLTVYQDTPPEPDREIRLVVELMNYYEFEKAISNLTKHAYINDKAAQSL